MFVIGQWLYPDGTAPSVPGPGVRLIVYFQVFDCKRLFVSVRLKCNLAGCVHSLRQ